MDLVITYVLNQMLPASSALPGVAEVGLRPFVRQWRRETTPLMYWGTALSAVVMIGTPVLTLGIPVPMFLLSARLRDRHLARAAEHPLYLYRQLSFVLKLVAGMCWGRSDEVRTRLGIPLVGPEPSLYRTA